MTRLSFTGHELADFYGLLTLYNYLKEEKAPFEIDYYTSEHYDLPRIIENAPHNIYPLSGNMVSVYSDFGRNAIGEKNLEIDLSILKNCVKPLAFKKKLELRKKYGIETDKPVVVFGHFEGYQEEFDLVRTVSKVANVIAVGTVYQSAEIKHQAPARYVTQWGVLKDYYALADAAVTDLTRRSNYLHNFVEATEGGPLFMREPKNPAQFGYRQLLDRQVIRAFEELGLLEQSLMDYIGNFKEFNQDVSLARSAHLRETRERYLPAIRQFLHHIYEGKDEPLTDLIVEMIGNMNTIGLLRLTHPETNWGRRSAAVEYSEIATQAKPDTNKTGNNCAERTARIVSYKKSNDNVESDEAI